MVLDCLTPETIPELEIRTGVPLVYRLKTDSTVAANPTFSTGGVSEIKSP